jgi:hypothetical protein
MNYEFHPEAELEIIESAAWYESEVPGLGLEFGEEVERVIQLLLESPDLGAAVEGDIRFALRRFPFSVTPHASKVRTLLNALPRLGARPRAEQELG